MSILDELKKQTQAAAEERNSFKKDSSTITTNGIIQGVGIPVEIERDGGKLRLSIIVSPEAISSPDTLNAVLNNIEEKFDLAIWKSRNSQDGFKSSYKKRW